MADIDSLAAALFGTRRAETQEVLTDATTRTYTGTAVTDSEDGTVMVDLGGDVTLPDDVDGISEQSAEGILVSTGPGVRAGDEVIVTLVGGTPLKTPMVTGVAGEGDGQNERIHAIEADYVKASTLEADVAEIGFLKADSATIKGLQADTAKVHDLTADQLSAATAYIASLNAKSVTAETLAADVAKVHDLTADQLSAAAAYIAQLSADSVTAQRIAAISGDFDTVRANAAKVANLTAAELEADHAAIGTLDTTYMHANMSNSDVAWISNGTIKDGAITNAMINSVSANKLTAGTIDASNITVTNLNADNITTGTINGQRIGEGSLSLDKLSEDVYTEAEVNDIVDGLNDRIDGAIETFTGTAVPTLNNQPASSWNTTKLRDEHVGDVYYVVNSQSQQDGYCYRFTKSGSTYSWQLIKDSDVTAALSRPTTAEGKITTFDSDISKLKTDTGTLTTKTESLETRMSDAEADILDKVDTTTFNEVSDTVDSHSQSITQMTTTLSNKADSSTVSTLTNRVSKTEQDISGINTTIGELQDTVEAKADGSTVSTISNKLNAVSDTVDGHTQTLTSVQNTLSTKADSSTVSTLTTKVNNVSDTVDGHTQTISGQSTILSNNGLTSSTNITNRVSSVEQDLSGYKTTVSETYATQTALATTNGNVTAAQTSADNAQAAADRANGRQVAYSATSSTGASTAAKVAACTNFPALAAGATVTVRFSAANTSTGAVTLNVNSTGAKTVYVNGAATSSSNQLLWGANANITFTYDGSYWRVDSEPRTWYGTGSVAAATAAKTATINEVVICKGTTVVLNMTNENTSTSATLNVTSTGAKNIYYGTTTTRPTTANGYGWSAGSTVSLTFDGQYWRIGDTTALSRLTAAESTISSHTTSISQNASAIALKADSSTTYTKTDVDGLISTEVTNRNAAITAKANEITSSVSETYATKTAVNGKADASDVTALAGRVTTAESNITQNAENITLRATKTEAYQTAQPNLVPWFSYGMPSTTNEYWKYAAGNGSSLIHFTDMGDGWARIQLDNSSGSSAVRFDYDSVAAEGIELGKDYTFLYELRNVSSSTLSANMYAVQATTYGMQFWGNNMKTLLQGTGNSCTVDLTSTINQSGNNVAELCDDGVYRKRIVRTSEASDSTYWTRSTDKRCVRLVAFCPAGSVFDAEVRFSIYEGEYTGPYKPYSGTQLYASQAELKVQADRIGMVVSNEDASSSLALTADAMEYIGDHVEILGADGTSTVISGGKVQANSMGADELNAADINASKSLTVGAMTDAAASTILNSNVAVGGRNLLRHTGSPVVSDLVRTRASVTDGVITITPTTSAGYANFKVDYLDFDEYGEGEYTVSFDAKAVSGATYTQLKGPIVYVGFQASSRIDNLFAASADRYVGYTLETLTYEWTRYSKTFTSPDSITTGQASALASGSNLTIELAMSGSYAPMQVRNVKLEKGNKATDWTPAPEDQEAYSYQLSQPNLSPFFSMPVTDNAYWYTTTNISAYASNMGDGWASFAENSLNINVSPLSAAMSLLSAATKYTVLLEVSNSNVVGTVRLYADTATNSMISATTSATITGDGEYRIPVTTKADPFADAITHFRLFLNASASGASFAGDVRLSLYEGEYSGPYKPYSGSQLYATSAELAGANSLLEDAVKDIETLQGALSDEVNGREDWLRFNSDGLVIGDRSSNFYTSVTESAMEFHNGDTVLATASGNVFDAPTMKSGEFHLGDDEHDDWMWTIRKNRNLSLKWIGTI